MKKAITLFLFIAFISLASGQKSPAVKLNQVIQKDSIKKVKLPVIKPEVNNDSTIIEKGPFKLYKKAAQASYYASKFDGRRTTSGQRFNNNKYTAAHRKFPFGTILRITNEANGKCVVVEVTDRGPFTKGREIDLTKRAYMEITGNKGSGSMTVKIEVQNQ